jgi:two-component system sensor histidine kinase EvgS
LAVTLPVLLAGFSGGDSLLAAGPADRPLVIGGDRNYPPFEYIDESGHPAGYNVDLTRAIARETGLNVEIRLGLWTERVQALAEGRIDALQGMFFTPGRDRTFDYSTSHMVNQYVAVVRRGEREPPSDLDHMTHLRIAVENGDVAVELLRENGLESNIHALADQEAALLAVLAGESDCALVTRVTALHLIRANNWQDLLEVGSRPMYSGDYAYAVRDGNKALLAHFSEGLRILEESGEYRRIQEKWLGMYEEESLSLEKLLRYALFVLIPLALIFAGVLLWIWSLRRLVARRTRELHANEAFQRAMIACSPVALYSTDQDGKVLSWNQSAERVFGWRADELIGRPLPIVPEDRLDEFRALREQVISGGSFFNKELERLRKDGSRIPLSLSVAPIQGENGEVLGIMGAAEDLTERRKAEAERVKLQEQLQQARKMESIGHLAGGVAHDFNNILQAISGNVWLLREQLREGDEAQEFVRGINDAVERASSLTRQLLAFARKQTINPKVVDLNHTVEEMLKMLGRLIGENIELNWHPKAGLWRVKVDPGQIDQALANLCVNARDAIEGSGVITIETDNVIINAQHSSGDLEVMPGDYVMLVVSDNGCGMERDVIKKIFDPFFTTKELHKGTGLGLATVYGIIRQNGGFINVYSEPGKGSTFKIYLPRHLGDDEAAETPPAQAPTRGHDELILLVEDEPSIRAITGRMLEGLGYTVLLAGTPQEAIELASRQPGAIRLLLTDVILPQMNGRELADQLRVIFPELRTVFMSGYTANVIAHQGVLKAGIHFLAKPFSVADLAAKVREALDQPDA